MKNISFLIPSIFVLLLVGIVIGVTVLSATEITVQAQVKAQQISVSVSDGDINYGVLSLSATKDTNNLSPDDTQTSTNNGNITAKFNIKGQTSDAWALTSGTPTGEQFRHRFSTDAGTLWTALTTSYATLDASVAVNATRTFDLEIMMSNNTTATASQDVDVMVQAAAP